MAAKRAKKSKKTRAKKRPVAAKARHSASKSRKAASRKSASRKPSRSKAKAARRTKKARKAAPGRRRKDVIGEGNYTATREFDKAESDFVKKNRSRIPEMGKEAEVALEGPEGGALRQAEAEARSHSHDEAAE